MDKIKKKFPGRFESLADISVFITENAACANFDEKCTYAIQMAVDEAASNIIDHAYRGEGIGDIEIIIEPLKNGIKVVLHDHGTPFDPSAVPEPDITSPLDERRERGLGVFFMRKLMDEVHFHFSEKEGNTLTMIKYHGG